MYTIRVRSWDSRQSDRPDLSDWGLFTVGRFEPGWILEVLRATKHGMADLTISPRLRVERAGHWMFFHRIGLGPRAPEKLLIVQDVTDEFKKPGTRDEKHS